MTEPRELVIFVGLPGAGKSTYYRAHFAATHALVSKDRMPNNRRPARRQRELIETALAEGRSVVVDNTNPTAADRAELIALARAAGARVVGFYFTSPLAECLERNAGRTGRARVPPVALYAIRKRLQPPRPVEGFDALFLVSARDAMEFETRPWAEAAADGERS